MYPAPQKNKDTSLPVSLPRTDLSMPRRLMLTAFAALLPACAIRRRQTAPPSVVRQPTTPEEVNPFVSQFNTYVASLQAGVTDTKQWQRVVRAWQRMTE